MTKIQAIEKKIKQLSPSTIAELEQFVNALLEKTKDVDARPIGQKWAGGLKDFREQYTSIDLQKKALDWRTR
jgi:hypothetical protein